MSNKQIITIEYQHWMQNSSSVNTYSNSSIFKPGPYVSIFWCANDSCLPNVFELVQYIGLFYGFICWACFSWCLTSLQSHSRYSKSSLFIHKYSCCLRRSLALNLLQLLPHLPKSSQYSSTTLKTKSCWQFFSVDSKLLSVFQLSHSHRVTWEIRTKQCFGYNH